MTERMTDHDAQRAAERRRPTPSASPGNPAAANQAANQAAANQAANPAAANPAAANQAANQAAANEPPSNQLLAGPDLEAVTRRWHEIQAGFVDAPQQAVKDADALVCDLTNRLTQMFTAERRQLESHWSRGDQVSTEELRVSLQRYRSFFQRLLSVH